MSCGGRCASGGQEEARTDLQLGSFDAPLRPTLTRQLLPSNNKHRSSRFVDLSTRTNCSFTNANIRIRH